jgi:hypothetical protein
VTEGEGAIRFLRWACRALTVVLATRTAYLAVTYLTGTAGVMRFQVESAAALFVIGGGVLALATSDEDQPELNSSTARGEGALPPRFPWTTWSLWCLASMALYWPSLSIGLLSDDLALASHAQSWQLGPVQQDLFRPLPLMLWAIVLRSAGGYAPIVLHLLNVLVHGTVAFLTTRIATPTMFGRWTPTLAGLFVLTFPASVEAVTWCSGVFDLTAALFSLAAISISRRYTSETAGSTRILFIAYALAAVLCKETALVLPILVLIDTIAFRRCSRQLLIDAGCLLGLFGIIGAARFSHATSLVKQPITKYMVQRWLFTTVGGLVVPWHIDVMRAFPWIPVVSALAVIFIATVFFTVPRSRSQMSRALWAGMWPLIATLPLITFLFLPPDLQNTRYLYLPGVGYAVLLSVLIPTRPEYLARIDLAVAIVLIVIGMWGVRIHQRPWQMAARLRDQLTRATDESPDMRSCPAVVLKDLPDTVKGAYVTRSAPEVLFGAHGVRLSTTAPLNCTFRWDAQQSSFLKVR